MTLPRISETVAYDGRPFNILDYPIIDDRPHIELSQCPGTIIGSLTVRDFEWHEGWEPYPSRFVSLDDFLAAGFSIIRTPLLCSKNAPPLAADFREGRIEDVSADPEVHLESLCAAIPILAARVSAIDAALCEVAEVLSGPPRRLRKAADILNNACDNLGDNEPCDVWFSAMCLAQALEDAAHLRVAC
jgi:hypothetical protein